MALVDIAAAAALDKACAATGGAKTLKYQADRQPNQAEIRPRGRGLNIIFAV
jgi:hypothetical protein